jgi:hypothetical protein
MARISEAQRSKWMKAAGIVDNTRTETVKRNQVATKKDSLKKLLEQLDMPEDEDEDLAPEGEEDFSGMPNLDGGGEDMPQDEMSGDEMGMEDELTNGDIESVINISKADAVKLTQKIAGAISELTGIKTEVETEGDMEDEMGEDMGEEDDFEASDEDMDMNAEDDMDMEPSDKMSEENPLPSIEDDEEDDEEYKAIAESIRSKIRAKAAAIKNKKKI